MNKNRKMARLRPCNACRLRQCEELECPKWQTWFLESWARVNQYAWAQMDELGREEPRSFVYGLPHEYKSPCETCRCSDWCDTPCSLRIKWWDARIGRLRKSGGNHAAR